MSTSLEALEAEALKLSPEEREHLLERLVISLAADPAVEKAWEEEIERREADLDSGFAQVLPADVVIARLRAKHLG